MEEEGDFFGGFSSSNQNEGDTNGSNINTDSAKHRDYERKASTASRSSDSTMTFARPPQDKAHRSLETQESINLLDFGGGSGDGSVHAGTSDNNDHNNITASVGTPGASSVNLLDFTPANKSHDMNGDAAAPVDLFAPALPQLESKRQSTTDENANATVDLFATDIPAGDADLLGSEPAVTASGEQDLFGQPLPSSEVNAAVDLFEMDNNNNDYNMVTTTPSLPSSTAVPLEDPFTSSPASGMASVSNAMSFPKQVHDADDANSVMSAPPAAHRQDLFGSFQWVSDQRSKSIDHQETSTTLPTLSSVPTVNKNKNKNSIDNTLPSHVHVTQESNKDDGSPSSPTHSPAVVPSQIESCIAPVSPNQLSNQKVSSGELATESKEETRAQQLVAESKEEKYPEELATELKGVSPSHALASDTKEETPPEELASQSNDETKSQELAKKTPAEASSSTDPALASEEQINASREEKMESETVEQLSENSSTAGENATRSEKQPETGVGVATPAMDGTEETNYDSSLLPSEKETRVAAAEVTSNGPHVHATEPNVEEVRNIETPERDLTATDEETLTPSFTVAEGVTDKNQDEDSTPTKFTDEGIEEQTAPVEAESSLDKNFADGGLQNEDVVNTDSSLAVDSVAEQGQPAAPSAEELKNQESTPPAVNTDSHGDPETPSTRETEETENPISKDTASPESESIQEQSDDQRPEPSEQTSSTEEKDDEKGKLSPSAEASSPTIAALPTDTTSAATSKGLNGERKNIISNTLFQLPGLRISRSGPNQTIGKSHKRGESLPNPCTAKAEQPSEPQTQNEPVIETSSSETDVLLQRIQKLEKELEESQSLVHKLQQNHKKDDQDAAAQSSLLVDLQTNLQTQMSQKAEAEDKLRRATNAATEYKEKLEALETDSKVKMEQLEKTLARVTKSKSEMETDLETARKERDNAVQKEGKMALRLNALAKKDAEHKNSVQYYEDQAKHFKKELEKTGSSLEKVSKERDQLKSEVTQWKEYAERRSKRFENALARERKLNEERKLKMKEFVEAKTEEVRVAKSDTIGLQNEVEQTNLTLKDLSHRYKQLHTQWVESQARNRELQRDITKMKKDSEKMSKVGGTLEAKLSRSAQESEDHKNKRLAAKNELMAVLRQLEAERNANARLRERIKERFTPAALSQQQSIQELLDSLEDSLQKVAMKLGRPVPPMARIAATMEVMADEGAHTAASSSLPDASAAASETNTIRTLNKLENETKRVSHYIEAASTTAGRLKSLVDAPSTRGCVDVFSSFLTASSAAPQN